MRSAPLWPMRLSVRAGGVMSGIRGTSMSDGCSRPARSTARGGRSAGTAGPACRRSRCRRGRIRPRALRAIRGRTASMTAMTSASPTRAGRAPRVEAAAKQPSVRQIVADARRPCAGRAARRRSARVGSSSRRRRRKRSRSNSGARTSGPSAASCWSKRVRDAVISSRTGPSNWTTSRPSRAQHQPRALRRPPPALPRREHAPPAGHPQVRVDRRGRPRSG